MPQTSPLEHPALQHLAAVECKHPKAWRQIENLRAARGRAIPDWPAWVYLPVAPIRYLVTEDLTISDQPVDGQSRFAADCLRLAALAAWRMTKGIYRLDTSLQEELPRYAIPAGLLTTVLAKLPDWCVYIETPGMLLGRQRLDGFFAHVDGEQGQSLTELHLAFGVEAPDGPELIHFALDLRTRFMCEAICDLGGVTASSRQGVVPVGPASSIRREVFAGLADFIKILVFLCGSRAVIRCASRWHVRMSDGTRASRIHAAPARQATRWQVSARDGDGRTADTFAQIGLDRQGARALQPRAVPG